MIFEDKDHLRREESTVVIGAIWTNALDIGLGTSVVELLTSLVLQGSRAGSAFRSCYMFSLSVYAHSPFPIKSLMRKLNWISKWARGWVN